MPTVSVVTASNIGKVSDTLALGLLGFAAVFILAAAFCERIINLGLSGGISIGLIPVQQESARKAVSEEVGKRTKRIRDQQAAGEDPGVYKIAAWAASTEARHNADAVSEATSDAVYQTSYATQLVINRAQILLTLGRESPDALRDIAETWGIDATDWPEILSGTIPKSVWNILAEHALDDAGIKVPAGRYSPAS